MAQQSAGAAPEDKKTFCVLPYVQGTTEPIQRVLNNYNIKVALKLHQTIGNLFLNLTHLLLYVRGETAEISTLFSAFSFSHILLRLGTDSLFVKVCPKDPNRTTTKHSRSQDPKLKVPLPKKRIKCTNKIH